MRRYVPIAAAALAAAGLALVPNSAGAAAPTMLTCGQTITENTVLGNDLVNCPGNGIIIGASGSPWS